VRRHATKPTRVATRILAVLVAGTVVGAPTLAHASTESSSHVGSGVKSSKFKGWRHKKQAKAPKASEQTTEQIARRSFGDGPTNDLLDKGYRFYSPADAINRVMYSTNPNLKAVTAILDKNTGVIHYDQYKPLGSQFPIGGFSNYLRRNLRHEGVSYRPLVGNANPGKALRPEQLQTDPGRKATFLDHLNVKQHSRNAYGWEDVPVVAYQERQR
jgi:hypothetical protein